MYKNLLLLFCFGMISIAHAQIVSVEYLMGETPKPIEIYDTKENPSKIFIPMEYGEAILLNPEALLKLPSHKIKQIDLVYTQYKRAKTFKQPKLNETRLVNLMAEKPAIFDNNLIRWNFFAQTQATSYKEGKKLFHGFVIHLHKKNSKTGVERNSAVSTEDEIAFIKEIMATEKGLEGITFDKALYDSLGPGWHSWSTPHTSSYLKFTGKYYPKITARKEKGILYDKRSIWKRERVMETKYNTTYSYDSIHVDDIPYGGSKCSFNHNIQDKTVLEVLNRMEQRMEEDEVFSRAFGKSILIEDVTGSMSPYTAQVLMWRKASFVAYRLRHYLFFNDGYHVKGGEGNVGGGFYLESEDYDEIEKKAFMSMNAFGGGDGPENNTDAAIKGIERCKDCEQIIMIADNMSPIKDKHLTADLIALNKPIKVIVCGTYGGAIHADYIQLAFDTKGSIHTIEEDFEDIATPREGKIFKIGSQKFTFKDGKLVLTR